MNYAPIYKIYQIIIAFPLAGLCLWDISVILPFISNEDNGNIKMIPSGIFSSQIASAQSIVPERNSTDTVVTPVTPSRNSNQTRFDVTGGKRSGDRRNLFHSFTRFNLEENQIVNFISKPNIENILTRVSGGDASVINGLIQVSGGNSNLFIMNPAGIIFGANARLDVPASFVVTTGSGIGFNSGWFNATGTNNYDILTGNPSAFSFPMSTHGVILNEGELTVEPGENITLLGGTIINTGTISAPGGEITISAVPGENLVRISQERRLLSLEIETENQEATSTDKSDSSAELQAIDPLSLPLLLTGNSEVMEMATGVEVNDKNQVVLTGSNQVFPSDSGTTIVSGSLDVSWAEKSELSTTGRINIFGEKIGLFGANINASGIYGSGNIRIGGDSQGLGNVPNATYTHIDEETHISASSFLGEGGNIVIWSNEATSFFGNIEANGNIDEQSVSRTENSRENLVEVTSQGFLIVDGSVSLGGYGISGTLSFGSEKINVVDGNIHRASNSLRAENIIESQVSKSSIENISGQANVIFQASDGIWIGNLSESQLNFENLTGKISFQADSDKNGLGSFTMNSGDTINTKGAAISISGTSITTGIINTQGGELSLSSSDGSINTNNLSTVNANSTGESSGENINIQAEGDVITREIISSGELRAGNIEINSNTGSIDTNKSNIDATSANSSGGNVTMNAAVDIDIESINAEGKESGGNIDITAHNNLSVRGISTSSNNPETGNIILSGNEINLLGGENSVSSNGRLTLQPVSENQNIILGGFENTEALNLTTADLATLANGFESITIGKSHNYGQITIAPANDSDTNGVIFDDPTNMQAEAITGTGTIIGRDNATITLNTNSDVSTGNINSPKGVTISSSRGNVNVGDVSTNSSGESAGNIEINTSGGFVETGNLTATGNSRGGNIQIQAGDRITTDRINSSATFGNAGAVKLSGANDIQVTSIQAEGGNIGGNVEIQTGGALRVIDTFEDKNRNIVSISTAGEFVGGEMTIETGRTAFTVGDATTNGTAGVITDGKLMILDRSLPGSFNLKQIESSSSQPQNSDSGETTTDSENQQTPPQPELDEKESTDSPITDTLTPEKSTDTSSTRETQPTEVSLPKTTDEVSLPETTETPTAENNSEPVDANQIPQITSQNSESNSSVLNAPESTKSTPTITENIENIKSSTTSEENINPPVVENQNPTSIEGLEQSNHSPLVVDNPEPTIVLEDTNQGLISSNSNQTFAIENPIQGGSSQKQTPSIIIEENITTTASEIAVGNYNQISLTDTVSQIELSRGREFASYLGENLTKRTVTAANIRNTLSSVAKIGVRPAIIYVSAQSDYLELQLFLPNGKPVVKSSGLTRDEVIQVANQFTNQIRTPRRLDSHDYLANAQQLYKWLIAPLTEKLAAQNINMIIFSMDSGLRTIPLAALHDGEQFLVEKYSLGLIPSFSLTDTRYVGLNGSHVLAMGASEFPSDIDQTPLPSVPVELKTIVNNLWPGKSFLNQGFTLANLKEQRSKEQFKIIHLATHGEFHPGGADNSYIQFWDTKLRLNQLRQLRLYSPQVELLVLSACTTAVGDEDAELGFAGLAVQAGVKSALASLWYVSDTGTLALMTEFYRHLSQRPIKAEALRQGQLSMLRGDVHLQDGHLYRNGSQNVPLPPALAHGRNRDLSHPYYWAAFTMIGSPW
ncbi:MAG: CHAT domain-containing protein [Microcoleaceae cyanobacterium MO_207.B10]|nr:CHAT domain-containing protein [Microcoleaceae cyanobacterium MO_207.B10]